MGNYTKTPVQCWWSGSSRMPNQYGWGPDLKPCTAKKQNWNLIKKPQNKQKQETCSESSRESEDCLCFWSASTLSICLDVNQSDMTVCTLWWTQCKHKRTLLSDGDMFQDLQWLPEAVDRS
jgi:hypothetical protein